MQKDQPSAQPVLAWNVPKAKPALLRPLRAMARTQMRIAKTPANVQKMAAVYVEPQFSIDLVGAFESTYIQKRQPFVPKSRYGIANESDGDENEIVLIRFRRKDSFTCVVLEDVDTGDEEEGSSEVDREGDDNVSKCIGPTADPGSDPTHRWRGKHEGLVVDASSRRVH